MTQYKYKLLLFIILAVTIGLVREEQLIHDLCILSAMTIERI